MRATEIPIHGRGRHWASGPDPAAGPWYEITSLTAPWTGVVRYRHDGDGDLEIIVAASGGDYGDPICNLPASHWPLTTKPRLDIDVAYTLHAVIVSHVDGEVTLAEVAGVTGGAVAAGDVTIVDSGGDFTATNVEDALAELQSDAEADAAALAAHLADTVDAHDATAISADSTTLVGTATHVQGVLEELDNAIADHLADTTDAHDASAISVDSTDLTGTGTDVQTVLEELDDAIAAAGATAVNQTGHGLSVGDVVRLSGGTYVTAQANTAGNAEAVGIVSAVADANNFTLASGGHVTGLSGLTAGTVYFLSASSAGDLTATEPSTAGQVSKPLLVADTTTSGYLLNFRGLVIGAAGGGGGGGGSATDVQTFNAGTGQTWTKPGGSPQLTRVILIGPGGGGGGGASSVNTLKTGGSGGGGCSVVLAEFPTAMLDGTEPVDVGTGGGGGGGGGAGAGANGSAGSDGSGPTSFGSWLSAYAGGGGAGGSTSNRAPGSGASTAGSAVANSAPDPQDTSEPVGGMAASGSTGGDGIPSEWGGASGGSGNTTTIRNGGASIFAGPGGGAGGRVSAGNVGTNGGAGGATQAYGTAGGGSAGAGGGSPTPGGNGTLTGPYCGEGGGGGGGGSATAGAAGGNGARGAGGGGGGASSSATSSAAGGDGGDGGDGYAIVMTHF